MSTRDSRDSRMRSVLKGLTWRCLATLTTYLLALMFAKDASVAVKIAGLEFFLKFLIYYLHERAWLIVPDKKG